MPGLTDHPLSSAGMICNIDHVRWPATLLSSATTLTLKRAAAAAAAAVTPQADEDGDEECGDDEGDDEEGFVVGDGYLSDDEGMRDEEEPLGKP
jgi:hypothetical protein